MVNLRLTKKQLYDLGAALNTAIATEYDYIDAHTPGGQDYPNLREGRMKAQRQINKYKVLLKKVARLDKNSP